MVEKLAPPSRQSPRIGGSTAAGGGAAVAGRGSILGVDDPGEA